MIKPLVFAYDVVDSEPDVTVVVLSCSEWRETITPASAVEGSPGSSETSDGCLIASVIFLVSFFACDLLFLNGDFFSLASLYTAVSFFFVLGFEKGANALVKDFVVCGSGLAAFLVSRVLLVEVSIEWIEVHTDVVGTEERGREIVVGLGRRGWALTPAGISITWNLLFV